MSYRSFTRKVMSSDIGRKYAPSTEAFRKINQCNDAANGVQAGGGFRYQERIRILNRIVLDINTKRE